MGAMDRFEQEVGTVRSPEDKVRFGMQKSEKQKPRAWLELDVV